MVNISSNLSSSGNFGAFRPPSPQKKSFLPYFIFIVTALILASGYYLFVYKGISFSFARSVITLAPPLTSDEVKASQLPLFQFNVFDDPFYKSLKNYGVFPIKADSLGRTNPFVPY